VPDLPEESMNAVPTGNHYDKYGASGRIARRLMADFLGAVDRALPVAKPARILEVGTGEGEIVRRLQQRWPDAAIAAVDLWDPELADQWADIAAGFAIADAGLLPFADDTFDLVVCIEVLEHLPDPARGLAEIARVASSRVVTSVPREPIWRVANMARGSYLGDLGNTPGHLNHWSTRSFRRFIEGHLDVVRVATPLPWTVIEARVRP
jgi:SAM-dependent methyltransferase